MEQLLAQIPSETRWRLLALYLDLLGPEFDTLARHLHSDAGEEAAGLLHKLAGGAAMLQDQDVAQPAHAMEAALLAGDRARARSLWAALQDAASRSRARVITAMSLRPTTSGPSTA